MDQVTQQNAALVEEASAAAQSLQEQAGSLSQAVGMFKLDQARGARRELALAPVTPQRPACRARRAPAPKARAKAATPPRKAVAHQRAPQLAVRPSAAGDWTEF